MVRGSITGDVTHYSVGARTRKVDGDGAGEVSAALDVVQEAVVRLQLQIDHQLARVLVRRALLALKP